MFRLVAAESRGLYPALCEVRQNHLDLFFAISFRDRGKVNFGIRLVIDRRNRRASDLVEKVERGDFERVGRGERVAKPVGPVLRR